MKKASYFVSEMFRKYHASKNWVWDVLEDELNIIKGTGALLTSEEWEDMENVVASGIQGEW